MIVVKEKKDFILTIDNRVEILHTEKHNYESWNGAEPCGFFVFGSVRMGILFLLFRRDFAVGGFFFLSFLGGRFGKCMYVLTGTKCRQPHSSCDNDTIMID